MKTLKKAWEWTKSKWKLFVTLLAGALGVLFLSRSRRIRKLRNSIALQNALEHVRTLQAHKVSLIEQGQAQTEAIDQLDKEIAENQKAIVQAHTSIEGMTDAEIASEFARLGY